MKQRATWLTIAVVLGFPLVSNGAEQMKVTSSAFGEGQSIPGKFTCDGPDTSPPLKIDGVPADTKALVLIVDDPDAPGRLFNHWLVWNIDPRTSSIAEGKAPGGVQGQNDFGKTGYGGPCPPSGSHRYFFRIFALDQPLNLPASARRADLDRAMNKAHVLGQGELMGRYARKK